MDTQTRYYSEKTNARRAARAAGVDPDTVIETPDGFTFAPKSEIAISEPDPLDIPSCLKLSAEERREGWAANPPKAASVRNGVGASMPKGKSTKAAKPKGTTGANKTETMLAMLKGNGATVEELTKATGWLPHTLRARISNVCKAKKDGGMGIKIERERVDGVTSYRLA